MYATYLDHIHHQPLFNSPQDNPTHLPPYFLASFLSYIYLYFSPLGFITVAHICVNEMWVIHWVPIPLKEK